MSFDSQLDQVNAVCARFKACWQGGDSPSLLKHLLELPESCRTDALRRLLKIELECRRERGDSLYARDYLEMFPSQKEVVGSVWEEFSLGAPTMLTSGSSAETGKQVQAETLDRTVGSTSSSSANDQVRFPELIDPSGESDSREYRISREIARGGMGAILLGHDPKLGRDLAFKVLLERHQENAEIVKRFVEEAQIGGQLQHPGIVPVYDLGWLPDHRLYFSMKLVKGKTLSDLLREPPERRKDLARFLDIFQYVCQTMAYAHSRRVIHRDLKPQNIMVGAFGEVQVMDWGLAKVLGREEPTESAPTVDVEEGTSQPADEVAVSVIRTGRDSESGRTGSSSQTIAGSVLGTPAYMSPEQALGEVDRLDERSDVFGLGAILCEILTGDPPYLADGRTTVHQLATRANLSDAWDRLEKSGSDRELINLARRCLAPNRDDRPLHAGLVAAELASYLESVDDRLRAAELERARAESRATEERKRRLVTLALAAFVLLTVVIGGGVWMSVRRQIADANREQLERDQELASQRAAEQSERAEQEKRLRQEADVQRNEAQGHLYAAQINLTQRALDEGRIGRMKELVSLQIPAPGQPDRRGWEWSFLARQSEHLRVAGRHESSIFYLDWNKRLVSSGAEGIAKVWNAESTKVKLVQEFPATSEGCYVHADGKRMATIDPEGNGRIALIDLETGEVIQRLEIPVARPRFMLWHPDGNRFALADSNHDIYIWDAETKKTLFRLEGHTDNIRTMAWHPDGTKLASAGNDRRCRLWSLRDGSEVYSVKHHNEHIWTVAFSSDGSYIATAGSDYHIVVMHAETGAQLTQLRGSLASVRKLAWGANHQLAAADDAGDVLIWQVQPRKLLATLRGHASQVLSVAWRPDGLALASGSADRTVNVWQLEPKKNPQTFSTAEVHDVAWSWKKDICASAGTDEKISLWNTATGSEVTQLSGQGESIYSLAWEPNGVHLASGAREGKLRIWNTETGSFADVPNQVGHVKAIAWSPVGNILASNATKDPNVVFWDVGDPSSPKKLNSVAFDIGVIRDVVFSDDGKYLAVAGATETVVWDIPANAFKSRILMHGTPAVCVDFSSGGHSLAIGTYDGTILVHNGSTGALIWRLRGHRGTVRSVRWHPNDTRRLASTSDDFSVRVWDIDSGHELLLFRDHRSKVEGLDWSPDGEGLASGSLDRTVRVWSAPNRIPSNDGTNAQ